MGEVNGLVSFQIYTNTHTYTRTSKIRARPVNKNFKLLILASLRGIAIELIEKAVRYKIILQVDCNFSIQFIQS